MLPHSIDRATVVDAARQTAVVDKSRIPIGLDESELAPVILDFDTQPHLVVIGDTGCGKTGLLQTIAEGLVENATPTQCQILMIDFRRALLGTVNDEYLRGYATSAQSCAELIAALSATLKDRLPPSDITQQQLKDRSWWRGPDLYVLIDDYDLIPGGSMNHPLSPLIEYLPQARDIGLRVVVSRRMGGAGRAMMDPIIGRLKDLSCNGLVMSGTKEEGALFGYKAQPMPPGRGMLISRTSKSDVIQLCQMPSS
jgi:S-DNA-T family DNA segregation ATPase FtsK/SpoIIIE